MLCYTVKYYNSLSYFTAIHYITLYYIIKHYTVTYTLLYFRSLLTGLFAPTSGSIEVYGMDMETYIEDVRKEMGVCMQYDVLFDHLTTKEHLLLYAQIKAPQWNKQEVNDQVCR